MVSFIVCTLYLIKFQEWTCSRLSFADVMTNTWKPHEKIFKKQLYKSR